MKILLVGVLDVPWSSNCSMAAALKALGHSVIPFNYRTLGKNFLQGKNIGLLKAVDRFASLFRSASMPLQTEWYYKRNGRAEMNLELLKTVKSEKLDLVIFCKTDTVNYNLILEMNKYASTWYYFMDPMDQAVHINAGAYAKNCNWSSATFSDVANYFTHCGAKAYWFTQGVDTCVFYPKTLPKKYDVVFVGEKTKLREHYSNILVSAGIKVECFGEGWKNSPVYYDQLATLYNQSKIALNFCREGNGFSLRVFQVLGSGCFLLSDYCADLEHFFKKTEHLEWYCNDDELVSLTKHYLQEDALREQIAKAGCSMVHQEHSWLKKMAQIMEIVRTKKTV